MWSKDKIAAAAQEIADQLSVTTKLKEIEVAQTLLAKELRDVRELISRLEKRIEVFALETRLAAVKETHETVMTLQGTFNDRLQNLTVEVDRLRRKDEVAGISRALPAIPTDGLVVKRKSGRRPNS